MKYPVLRFRSRNQLLRFAQEMWGLCRLRLDRELWRSLFPILRESSSVGCTFYELWILYKHICNEKPSYILECGSGISTVVIGYAVKKVRKEKACWLVSMEESAEYYDDINRLVPEDLRDCLEIVLSPVEDRTLDNGQIARCYTQKPKHPYDLVFVDGPEIPSRKEDSRYFDGDVSDVLDWNENPLTVFLDARVGTKNTFLKLFPYVEFKYAAPHKFSTFHFPASDSRK